MRRSTLIPKTHLPLLLRSPFSSSSSSNGSHHSTLLNLPPIQELDPHHFTPRKAHFESIKLDAQKIFHILRQDGPGFNFQSALDELSLTLSTDLARQVLILILCSVNAANKPRTARLAYKFFVWAGQCPDYKHTANTYNLTLKIFAETDELKAMWRLVDDMTEYGIPITALTFNILICACGEAGMARKVVERFLKSKDFNYRPFKHSFNAILYSLLTVNQFRLVEWVYQKMVLEGYSPDLLTYNVVMRAKYRLGKLEEFQRVMDEMGNNGFVPDRHTYNLLLHVLGKADKFQAANELLDYMDRVGCSPSVLHFTTLIDGFSRAGNLDACKHFFDMMGEKGCEPDVVSYTVLITGYVLAGEFEKAHVLFDDMLVKGQLPNVYTYNSIIRGLCVMGKFDEACELLKSMDSRGCVPNFSVYSTLVRRLRNAGKSGQAHEIISYMVEKGHYLHLLFKFKGLDAAVLDLVADDGAGLQKQKSVYHWDKKSKKYIKLNNGERVTASWKIKTESGAKVKASKTGIYKKWKERSHKQISLDGSKDTKEDGTAHGGGRQIRGGNKWQLKGGRNRRSIPNANVPSELRDPEQVRKDRQQKATKIAQFKNKLSSKKGNNKFGKDKGNSKFGKDKGNNKFGKNKGQKKSKGRF